MAKPKKEFEHLSSLQLTKEECRVLEFLRRKERKEAMRYRTRDE